MSTLGDDDGKAAAASLQAVAKRAKRQPTVGELVQIVKYLLLDKWKRTGLVRNPASKRDLITRIFEEALYIWMIADKVCYRHKTGYDSQADRAEATKSWDALNEFGGAKIEAKNAHKLLGWTEKEFLTAWKKHVKQPFDPELKLSRPFVDTLASVRKADCDRMARARKERYKAKKPRK